MSDKSTVRPEGTDDKPPDTVPLHWPPGAIPAPRVVWRPSHRSWGVVGMVALLGLRGGNNARRLALATVSKA